LCSQSLAKKVGSRTSAHPDSGSLDVRGKGDELLLRELHSQQQLAGCAQGDRVKRRLAMIDTYRMNLHVDDLP
jgi:hypothetical protein